jgi:hypothetical protein
LPLSTPDRDVPLFIAFGVILVTLVGQGLTLPRVTRRLWIGGDGTAGRDEANARTIAAEAAQWRASEELAREWPGHLPLIDTLRSQYAHGATHLGEAQSGDDASNSRVRDAAAEQELPEHRLIRRAVIDAERAAVLRLRDRGAINDDARRQSSATWISRSCAWRLERTLGRVWSLGWVTRVAQRLLISAEPLDATAAADAARIAAAAARALQSAQLGGQVGHAIPGLGCAWPPGVCLSWRRACDGALR